jgi:hypothetical protein
MMRVALLRQRFRSALPKKALDARPFGPHPSQVEPGGAGTSDHNEVDPVGDQAGPRSEALSAEPLDAISPNGVADAPAHHEAESRRAACPGTQMGRLRGDEQRKVCRPYPPRLPLTLSSHEFRVLAEPTVGTEGHGAGSSTRPRVYFL